MGTAGITEKVKQELMVCLVRIFDPSTNPGSDLCLDINFQGHTVWMQITTDCLNMYWPDDRDPDQTLMAISGLGAMTQLGFEPSMYATYSFLDDDPAVIAQSVFNIIEQLYQIDIKSTPIVFNIQDLS